MRDETPEEQIRRLEAEEWCAQLARDLQAKLPEGIGFALFLFDTVQPGNLTYVSNAKREAFLSIMHEFIAKVGKHS